MSIDLESPEEIVVSLTPEKLHKAILPKIEIGYTLIDAIVEYSEETNIDLEDIGNVIKRSVLLKEMIGVEASALNMVSLPKESVVDLGD